MITIILEIEGNKTRIATRGFGAANTAEQAKVKRVLEMITDALVVNNNMIIPNEPAAPEKILAQITGCSDKTFPNEPSTQKQQDNNHRPKRNG